MNICYKRFYRLLLTIIDDTICFWIQIITRRQKHSFAEKNKFMERTIELTYETLT